ncbi:ABC transporter [Vibrio sp. 10N.286.49.B3]|uniref:MlaA family lipoprotein n=1 Tax=Vibrio sp. 10N.286.49.B3 TaxID=1880855 RepID=UPI000CC41F1C|nr:MlaA family lipoprotein [Vibrio sp. 10N.286.49.B3]PMH41007.1 ABC transporter [Vibrio sp. 10N.286.49.B3]
MPKSYLRYTIMSTPLILLLGCSSAPDTEQTSLDEPRLETSLVYEENLPDSSEGMFEGFNRAMWDLNSDYLDPYFVRPVSVAYVGYTPTPLRRAIANFLANLDEPSSVINNAIMGNGEKAVTHFNRFWINSTFGLLGLIDIAGAAGITKLDDKAFGDAIGHYGVGMGPYLMLPGYGPVTVREAADTVDGMYLPLSYLNFWSSVGKWAFEGMEKRALLIPQEAQLENSPDPYVLTRDIYIQRQNFKAEVDIDTYDEEEEAYFDDYLDEDF